MGAMPFLFWRLIEESKNEGAGEVDFGRSDLDNEGLLAFKEKFGTTRKTLNYYRYPEANKKSALASWKSAVASRAFSYLPNSALSAVGQLLYKHVG